MYLTFPNQDSMEEDFLEQTKGRDIQLFVCSDAEAILGIGDQGVGVREFTHRHRAMLILTLGYRSEFPMLVS